MILPLEYINYYLVAKGRQGIHSPFAYDFIDKCVRLPIDGEFISKRDLLFSDIKYSNEIISVEDFGAGSKKMGKQRKVSSIFKNSSSKGKYADLLYRLSNFYQPKRILELGTSLGIGTIHLQAGNKNSDIITVEACPKTLAIAQKNFQLFDLNIRTINSTFQQYISQLKQEKFDLVYIDGHHDGNALLAYLESLKPFIHNDTLLILDDIRWSNSMIRAWKNICKSDFYHVSIELLRMGIVTPRKQQIKQHFIFRY
jgi:predicted O-methyltransferase YrrM